MPVYESIVMPVEVVWVYLGYSTLPIVSAKKRQSSMPWKSNMHQLLKAQVQQYLSESDLKDKSLQALFEAVDKLYCQAEGKREKLEVSLDKTARKLKERNQELERKVAELESTKATLEQSFATLNATFDATGAGIIAFDTQNRILKSNKTANEALGLSVDNEGENLVAALVHHLSKKAKDSTFIFHDLKAIKIDPQQELFGVLELNNHEVFEYHSVAQVKNQTLLGRVWSFRNITEHKKNEALVMQAAYYDILTGLPNRLLILERVERAIQFARRSEDLVAVIFIDMDNFKRVNDICGHQAGDELIRLFANRVANTLREHDTLARLGGDEFVVLLENLRSHRYATEVCKRILSVLAAPFYIDQREFHISCSLGISVSPRDGHEAQLLIKKADMAMYHAKQLGKNNFQYFNPALERLAIYQMELEEKLRRALKENELELYYQPILDLNENKIVSFEVLLRWFEHGGVSMRPDEFIVIAEQTGLIVDIGAWVFRRVCEQLACWKETLGLEVQVSVNLSPRQLKEKNFIQDLKQCLAEYNVDGQQIEFEITETSMMEELDDMRDLLEEIRALNIKVAIDDFGTGYSSLSYLKNLPINSLKIDKSFILELDGREDDAAIARSIISIAHNLKLSVTAEGVENEQVLHFLRLHCCDRVQGYFFHKPLPVATVNQLLCDQEARAVSVG